jgi:hypothetical protein
MAGVDKKLTDLIEKATVPDNSWIHIVDPSDISQSPQGSSFKVKKSNFGGLSDAPSDGEVYGRKDGDWEVINLTFGSTITRKTITSTNLTTQDITGFLTYVNGVTAFAIAANEHVIYEVTDTRQAFLIYPNNRSVGSGQPALTSSEVIEIERPKDFIIVSTTSSGPLSGSTSAIKLVENILIPAGTFRVGDFIRIKVRVHRTVPTSGNTGITVSFSPIINDSPANLVTANKKYLGSVMTATNRYVGLEQDIIIKSATISEAYSAGTATFSDNTQNSNTIVQNNTDWTVNQYFYILLNNAQLDTASFISGYSIERIRQT